jgi:hypothetical protein
MFLIETYLTLNDLNLPPITIQNDSTPKPAKNMKQAIGKALSKGNDLEDVESEANEKGFDADEQGFEDNEEGFDSDGEVSEDGYIVTPRALRKSPMIPSKSDLSDTSSAESGEADVRNQAQESDHIADVKPEERMKSGNIDQSKPYLEWNLQRIDLSKVQKKDAQSQEKRAPHKEVEERRVVAKETNKV